MIRSADLTQITGVTSNSEVQILTVPILTVQVLTGHCSSFVMPHSDWPGTCGAVDVIVASVSIGYD